jgi:hypothetical protein
MNENVKKALLAVVVVVALVVAALGANRALRSEGPVDVITIDAGPDHVSEKDRAIMQQQGGAQGGEPDLSGG